MAAMTSPCCTAFIYGILLLPWIPRMSCVVDESKLNPENQTVTTTDPTSTVTVQDPITFCGPPPVDKASVSWPDSNREQFSLGETISLACVDESYTLHGPSTLTCVPPAVWNMEGTVAMVTCQYVECEALKAPTNGTVHLSKTPATPGTTATLGCNHGYQLSGVPELSCTTAGVWSNATPTCREVWCEPPTRINDGTFITQPLPNESDQYTFGTLAEYSCYPGYDLTGDVVLSCTGSGEWNGTAPNCTAILDNDTKDQTTVPQASPQSTSTPLLLRCPTPERIPHSVYSIHNRTVTYSCDMGHRLHGDEVRYCQGNGTWSGKSPHCLPLSQMDSEKWREIFTTYKEWQGKYLYNEGEIGFKFWYLSSTDTSIHALLRDDVNSKLDLEVSAAPDGVVEFETSRLLLHSAIIHDRDWKVHGELSVDKESHWRFNGVVHSEHKGFSSLYMTPVIEEDYEPPPLPHPDSDYTSATALALGIAIAVMAIIVAALLAAYCVKHRGSFKMSGHRTLTSFQNPVYDYDNTTQQDDPEVALK